MGGVENDVLLRGDTHQRSFWHGRWERGVFIHNDIIVKRLAFFPRVVDGNDGVTVVFDDMQIVAKMKEIVPEYKSNNSIYQKLDK